VEMEEKKLIFKAEDEGCGFDIDTEWDFVKALMKNLMPHDTEISWAAEERLRSKEWLASAHLLSLLGKP
jgi:hypothetical protein